ncbi:NADH dehydrogenase [ubiquinone] 1 alpha subcomplex subunit 8-like [Mytilus trossulus]|uniref:NADH dehydrogenase [ubiquinone] 1 alpha subcomplex subunit 8-like n=1 Tax=Mytilus trossulus TaxID=6551 RepID=UPI003005BCE8
MAFTNEDYLPSHEELTVPELPLTSSVLRASGVFFGKYCDNASKEFMLCVSEEKDPRKCINEGKEVTRCGWEFYRNLKKNCQEEFNVYHDCVDRSGSSMDIYRCRKPQAPFDQCMKEKMNMERPPIGYFSRARIHHTKREIPKLNEEVLPEKIPGLEDFRSPPKKDIGTNYGTMPV